MTEGEKELVNNSTTLDEYNKNIASVKNNYFQSAGVNPMYFEKWLEIRKEKYPELADQSYVDANFNQLLLYFKKDLAEQKNIGMVLPGGSYKDGGKLLPRVQKAQSGTIDWTLINNIINPKVPNLDPNVRFGQTGNYKSDNSNLIVPLDRRSSNTGTTNASTAGSSAGPTEESMQIKEPKQRNLYRQEGSETRSTLLPKPILSTTGINTPVGEVQYNDIAQLFLMLKAKNKKLADVPVNLDKFVSSGSRNVLAARDIDSAMLNQANQEISKIKSTYKGSDPILSMISSNVANANKQDATVELIGKRAEYRRSEEDRVAAQMEEKRQQEAANLQNENAVRNSNSEKLFQADLMKANDKARRETEFLNNLGVLSADIQSRWNVEATQRKQLQTGLELQERQNKVNQAQSEYQSARNYYTDLRYGVYGQPTPEMMEEARKRIETAEANLKSISEVNVDETMQQASTINMGEGIWRWKK
jgi:hypothetical protein